MPTTQLSQCRAAARSDDQDDRVGGVGSASARLPVHADTARAVASDTPASRRAHASGEWDGIWVFRETDPGVTAMHRSDTGFKY